MLILNLGCGTRTAAHPNVVNVDWSLNIRIKNSRLLRLAAAPLLDSRRRSRLSQMGGSLLAHDLAKGIPYADNSVDAVYHSHVLEHLDRPIARAFIAETLRVLKPGGICRIVVPDFEIMCRAYVQNADRCRDDPRAAAVHESFIEALLEQSVRREAAASQGRRGFAQLAERLVLGDARRRGETHQWMYDRFSLPHLLKTAGYSAVTLESWTTSRIPEWQAIALDGDGQGGEYTPDSLYVEAHK